MAHNVHVAMTHGSLGMADIFRRFYDRHPDKFATVLSRRMQYLFSLAHLEIAGRAEVSSNVDVNAHREDRSAGTYMPTICEQV